MWQPSGFSLPENTIMQGYALAIAPKSGLDCSPTGLGQLGCAGGCSSCSHGGSCESLHGLGDFSSAFDDFSATLQGPSPILGLPWLYVIGGAALLYLLFGTRVDGSEYKYQKASARRDYANRLRELGEEHPSRGRRAGQIIGEGYSRAKKAGSWF